MGTWEGYPFVTNAANKLQSAGIQLRPYMANKTSMFYCPLWLSTNTTIASYVNDNNKFWGESGGSDIYIGYYYFGNYAINNPKPDYPTGLKSHGRKKIFQDLTVTNHWMGVSHKDRKGAPKDVNSLFTDGSVVAENIRDLSLQAGGTGCYW
jgi:hypothetical protein